MKQGAYKGSIRREEENPIDMNQRLEEYSIAQEQKIRLCNSFCGQLSAQMKKRSIIWKRNLITSFVKLMAPIFLVLAGLCLTLIQFFFDSTAYPLLPSTRLPTPSTVYISANPHNPANFSQTFSSYFESGQINPPLLTYTPIANQTTDLISFKSQRGSTLRTLFMPVEL